MCLGIPGQIISISGKTAVVDFWGTRKEVHLDSIEEAVLPGDYVINHAGFAVRVIPPDEVMDTLALYETILAEAGEDPIEREVVCAMHAAEDLMVSLVARS
jgi:hydrogenase expression/formation protein HypC